MVTSEQEWRARDQEQQSDRELAERWAREMAEILAEEEERFAEWWMDVGASEMAHHYSEV